MTRAYQVAPVLALVALLSAVAYLLGVFAPLDNALSATRFHTAQRSPTGSVAVVDIDAKSLATIGAWPWSRQIHAQIIQRLVASGAAAIALDIDFSTTSNSVGDAALENALREAGGAVILAAFRQPASDGTNEQIVNYPIERFARNAWIGTVNVWPDADGAVRNSYFGEPINGIPVLSIAALLSGRSGTLGSEFGIDFSIAADEIDRISAIDLIEGRVDPSRIAGRSFIVAASAVELGDIFEVPVYGFLPGGVLQALAAETLIQQRELREAGGPPIFVGLALLAVFATLLLVSRLGWRSIIASFAAVALGIELLAFAIQTNWHLVVPTGAWHFALLAFAAVGLAREVDLRGLAAAAFRRESFNTRTVLERVVEDSFAGIVVADQRGTILAASDAVSRILRLPSDLNLVGMNQSKLLPAPISEALDTVIRSDSATPDVKEMQIAAGDGENIILEVTVTASVLEQGRGRHGAEAAVVGCVTFVDVTEKRHLEARTAQLAWYDGLTGLPNRNYFTEALRAAIREVTENGGRSALLFFDVDRFKNVNDTLGHHFGDLLLGVVAKRAQDALDESGLLVRLGGDEFAVIAPNLNHAEIAVLAKQIIAALSIPFMLEGYRVAIGASAGISLIEPGNRDPAVVMRQADLALHAAKSDGSGHRFFDPSMDDSLDERRQIEVALWDALQNSELEIAYQPQVDLVTGRIVGVEALSRWMHPELGAVPPDHFVPIAEATGLIDQIGSAVLMRACQAVAPLGDLTLSVNVSPVQFVRGDLLGVVSAALSASKLEPSRLELEITEMVFLGSGDLVRKKMRDLKKLGVTLALDDFGTGYSSLSYVREFPFDVIKIDRSFVSRILVDPSAAAIVRAVLAMAEGLNKRVVAEGVESEDQRRLLELLGCKEGQGFLFGKAVPAAELKTLLSQSTELPEKLSA